MLFYLSDEKIINWTTNLISRHCIFALDPDLYLSIRIRFRIRLLLYKFGSASLEVMQDYSYLSLGKGLRTFNSGMASISLQFVWKNVSWWGWGCCTKPTWITKQSYYNSSSSCSPPSSSYRDKYSSSTKYNHIINISNKTKVFQKGFLGFPHKQKNQINI